MKKFATMCVIAVLSCGCGSRSFGVDTSSKELQLEDLLKKIDMELYGQSEADLRAWLDGRIAETGDFGVYPFRPDYVSIERDTARINLNRGGLADSAAQFFRAYEMFGDEKYLHAGLETAQFFLQIQQPEGHFPVAATIKRGGKATARTGMLDTSYARFEDGFQFRPFALLLYAYKLTGDLKYLNAAKRNGDMVANMQDAEYAYMPDYAEPGASQPEKAQHNRLGVTGGGSYSDYATTDGFRTAVMMYHLTKDEKYLRKSAKIVRWLFATQLGKGKVRGWADNYDNNNKPVPARPFEGITIDPRNFNRFTGPLLTWFYAITGEQRYFTLFEETYNWLAGVEGPDGWAAEYDYDGTECWTENYKLYRYDEPNRWPKDARVRYFRSKVQLDDSKKVLDILRDSGFEGLRNWYRGPVKYNAEQYLQARLAAAKRSTNEELVLPLQSTVERGVKAAIKGKYLQRVRAGLAAPNAPDLPSSDSLHRTGLKLQSWYPPHTWYEPYRPPFGWAQWQFVWDVRLALGKIDPGTAASGGRGLENQHYWPSWDVMGDWTTRAIEVEDWMDVPLKKFQ